MGEKKQILLIGGTGLIGSVVGSLLAQNHNVIRAARSGGDVVLDAESPASVQDCFSRLGLLDAIVCTFGAGAVGRLEQLAADGYMASFRAKVLAQISIVQNGVPHLRDGGSFTLSSGFLSVEPIPGVSAIAMVNAAVDGFCRAAALDLPRGLRINAISPVFTVESLESSGMTDAVAYSPTMTVADTAKSYLAAVEGTFTGRIIDPRQGS